MTSIEDPIHCPRMGEQQDDTCERPYSEECGPSAGGNIRHMSAVMLLCLQMDPHISPIITSDDYGEAALLDTNYKAKMLQLIPAAGNPKCVSLWFLRRYQTIVFLLCLWKCDFVTKKVWTELMRHLMLRGPSMWQPPRQLQDGVR